MVLNVRRKPLLSRAWGKKGAHYKTERGLNACEKKRVERA